MELIHTKLARSIWLFDLRDLNPTGKDILGDLVGWIQDTYGFPVAPDRENPAPNAPLPTVVQTPQTAPTQASGGLIFQRGSFQVGQDLIGINSLTIYDDGIVVDTASSTDDGDRFAKELLESAKREFGLAYEPAVVRRKLYLSELIIHSDMRLETHDPALATFAQKLPTMFAGGESLRFGVGSIAFWSEPNDAGLHRVISIERQLGRSFSEQRFYSQAPMRTIEHLQVLKDFEASVSRR